MSGNQEDRSTRFGGRQKHRKEEAQEAEAQEGKGRQRLTEETEAKEGRG